MYTFNSKEELTNFISQKVIDTTEAAKLLGCSRQYINKLVKQQKLIPIKELSTIKIFFKEDVLNLK